MICVLTELVLVRVNRRLPAQNVLAVCVMPYERVPDKLDPGFVLGDELVVVLAEEDNVANDRTVRKLDPPEISRQKLPAP